MKTRTLSARWVLIIAAIVAAFVSGVVVSAVAQPAGDDAGGIPANYFMPADLTVVELVILRTNPMIASMADLTGLRYTGYDISPEDDMIGWSFVAREETLWDAQLVGATMAQIVNMGFERLPADCWKLFVAQGDARYIYTDGQWTETTAE